MINMLPLKSHVPSSILKIISPLSKVRNDLKNKKTLKDGIFVLVDVSRPIMKKLRFIHGIACDQRLH